MFSSSSSLCLFSEIAIILVSGLSFILECLDRLELIIIFFEKYFSFILLLLSLRLEGLKCFLVMLGEDGVDPDVDKYLFRSVDISGMWLYEHCSSPGKFRHTLEIFSRRTSLGRPLFRENDSSSSRIGVR